MPVAETITEKLQAALMIQNMMLVDESDKHIGHAGARPGGESHFQLYLVADDFIGQNRVARQRLVYRILAAEMAGPVHALSLDLRAPDEVSHA